MTTIATRPRVTFVAGHLAKPRRSTWVLGLLTLASFQHAALAQIRLNEVAFAPAPDSPNGTWFELRNVGETTVDLNGWWMCVQPGSQYFRLLQVPQHALGLPTSPSIVLGPGDYLAVRWDQGVNGDYSAGPCDDDPAATCHVVSADPCFGVPCVPVADDTPLHPAGNLAIYEFFGPSANFPTGFGSPSSMRDFVQWAPGGAYQGAKRAETAIAADLWPPGMGEGDLLVSAAVDTTNVTVESGLSLQHAGTLLESPEDYFVAPATWLAASSAVPFDVDADADVDLGEYEVFHACLTGDPDAGRCELLDSDLDGLIDLADFAELAPAFTGDIAPSIGDVDGDGLFSSSDVAALETCLLGPTAVVPLLACVPLDADQNNHIDLADFAHAATAFASNGNVP